MVSFRARLVNWYLRHNMKSEDLTKAEPADFRIGAERIAPKRPPRGVSLELVDGAVRGEWHRADDAADGRTILFCHGGGYFFGSPISHRGCTFALAKSAKANVFSLDYRLGPEHKLPAAQEDAVAAWRWLLDEGVDPSKTVFAGDSAGGGLSLLLAIAARDSRLPAPAGLLLYSPWTDLSGSSASLVANEPTDVMFRAEHFDYSRRQILGDMNPADPRISPLFADFGNLPPALIFVSDAEALLDDSLRLAEKMQASGNSVTLVRAAGLAHVWPIFAGRFPEANRAIAQSAEFIQHCVGG